MTPFRSLKSLPKTVATRFAQSWQACVIAGALTGVVLFSPANMLAGEEQVPGAPAAEIDRAVQDAEKAADAARQSQVL